MAWFEVIFVSWNGFIVIFEKKESREAIVRIAILFHMRLFRTENLVAMEAWRNGFSTLFVYVYLKLSLSLKSIH